MDLAGAGQRGTGRVKLSWENNRESSLGMLGHPNANVDVAPCVFTIVLMILDGCCSRWSHRAPHTDSSRRNLSHTLGEHDQYKLYQVMSVMSLSW